MQDLEWVNHQIYLHQKELITLQILKDGFELLERLNREKKEFQKRCPELFPEEPEERDLNEVLAMDSEGLAS